MARPTSRKSSDANDGTFDLSRIFIGRQQQLDFFELYFHRWKQLMHDAESEETFATVAPSPNHKIQGLLILLYGRGGFGKSTLLRRYREMALERNRNPLSSQVLVS